MEILIDGFLIEHNFFYTIFIQFNRYLWKIQNKPKSIWAKNNNKINKIAQKCMMFQISMLKYVM